MRWLYSAVMECELINFYFTEVQRLQSTGVYDAEPHCLFVCCTDAPEYHGAVLQVVHSEGIDSKQSSRKTACERVRSTGRLLQEYRLANYLACTTLHMACELLQHLSTALNSSLH